MAGQPKRRAMIEALESRTREYFEDDPTQSVLDYVSCWIQDGGTMRALADSLSKEMKVSIHRHTISDYLRKTFGEEATDDRLARSRVYASHMIAEDALTISDEDAMSSEAVARNGLRVKTRQWTAERWNPAQYGQRQQTNVAISITSLHLDALRHASTRVTGSSDLAQIASGDTVKLVEAPRVTDDNGTR